MEPHNISGDLGQVLRPAYFQDLQDHTTGNGHYVYAESSNYAEDRAS